MGGSYLKQHSETDAKCYPPLALKGPTSQHCHNSSQTPTGVSEEMNNVNQEGLFFHPKLSLSSQ